MRIGLHPCGQAISPPAPLSSLQTTILRILQTTLRCVRGANLLRTYRCQSRLSFRPATLLTMDLLLPFAGSGSALGARSRQAAGLYRR